MVQRFEHDGEIWEAEYAGAAHGVGTASIGGELPKDDRFRMNFRRVSDGVTYTEWISTLDVDRANVEQLRAALKQAIAENRRVRS